LYDWKPASPISFGVHLAHPITPELTMQCQLPAIKPHHWRSPLIPQTERQSSFTSLSHHGAHSLNLGDQLFTSHPEPIQDLMPSPDIPNPEPGGTQFGIIFHAAMEFMDFESYHQADVTSRDQILNRLFSEKLEKLARGMRFGNEFPSFNSIKDYLRQQLHAVMNTLVTGPGNTVRPIHALDGTRARREATFHARVLELSQIGIPSRFELSPRPLDPGFLTGSIDFLVPIEGRWAIIDWKTNRAGTGTPSDLAQVMHDNEYHLQALIYQSAVHQWLCTHYGIDWDAKNTVNQLAARERFETKLGPVWYVFTRYGQSVDALVSWEELLEFQQMAVLYAHPL